jgi:hypothetical protein
MMHLTHNDYEDSLSIRKKTPKKESSEEVLFFSQYRMFVDALKAEMHRKYDLRPRQRVFNHKIQTYPKNLSSSIYMDKVKELKNTINTKEVGETLKLEKEVKEPEESVSPFNFEKEILKINISVPLAELTTNPSYHKQIEKGIQGKSSTFPPDMVNLQDESPTMVFGPHIDDKEESVAPFYVTLNIHDKMLHKYMLDSIASHNLMPKLVMEKLELEITRPYHNLYSFNAKKVKCDGLIKDMVVALTQLHVKSIIMNVVVVDVPENYGMILSLTWARNIGGTMKMEMTYATVPVFGGENRILCRETKFSSVVSDQNNSINHPIYAINEYLGCASSQ